MSRQKGYKHTEETKRKQSISKLGDKNPMKRPEVVAKKSGKNHHMFGKKWKKHPFIGGFWKGKEHPFPRTRPKNLTFKGKHQSEEHKNKLRLLAQERILKNKTPIQIGKNEKQILDSIERVNNIKIIRQYPVKGFFVDGYCKERNIVFEIDEKHHKFRKKKDLEREQIIKQELKCDFIRLNDKI